jgi:Arc/MetJ-type ribon-helix-helix transcriptional regulator
MKTVQAEIPDQLYQQVKSLITEGWFRNEGDLLQEALRRFLESHYPELMDRFIRQDVEWGLHGKD